MLTGRREKDRLDTSDPTRNRKCSQLEANTWQLSELVVNRLVPIVGVHPFPVHEIMLMAAAICRMRPSHIFEWGTHIGKSARIFHEVSAQYGIHSHIHSVDLPDDVAHVEHPSKERGRLVRGSRRVTLHQGDGLDVSLATWVAEGGPRDVLFFVDGDHSETSVYRELSGIVGAIERPAVLLHDAFYQSPESGYNIGPYLAIERVLKEYPSRFKRVDSGLGLPGMTLLYPA
jgi:cephalosporin hydroxylase